jgi:hypothetical protein
MALSVQDSQALYGGGILDLQRVVNSPGTLWYPSQEVAESLRLGRRPLKQTKSDEPRTMDTSLRQRGDFSPCRQRSHFLRVQNRNW